MMRRARWLSALVVLVTLGSALLEAAWAATCAPAMLELARAEAAAPLADMPADHDCTSSQGREQEPAEDPPRCPLPAGMSQGCAAAASLPAHNTNMTAPASELTPVIYPSERSAPLLQGATIFHPPKA